MKPKVLKNASLNNASSYWMGTPLILIRFTAMLYTWSIQKIMRLFLQKMHNIKIQNFQFIFFKFSSASFKTNITFCYLAFKFIVFAQRIAQKCILRRLALVQVSRFISNSRIVWPNQTFNYSN